MSSAHDTPLLKPGFPANNAVLAGLSSLLAGADVEAVLLQRDAALPTSADFCQAAWEALAWLAWPHPITEGLLQQLAVAMSQVPADMQRETWGQTLPTEIMRALQTLRGQAA